MVDPADGVSEGAAAEALEALDVGAGRVELVMRDGVGGGKLSAAGESIAVSCADEMSVTSRPITPPISAFSKGKCVQPSTSVSISQRRSGSR